MHYSVSVSSTFPMELRSASQGTHTSIPRMHKNVEGFPNTLQISVTNMRPSISETDTSLMKEKVEN